MAQMVKNPPAMQEIQVWPQGQEDPPEKGMTTHSIVLVWRTLWPEEPGRLESTGLQSNRVTNTHTQNHSITESLCCVPLHNIVN